MSSPDDQPGLVRALRVPRATKAPSIAFAMLLVSSSATAQELTQVHERWVWTSFGEGIGSRGLEAADLDGDGRAEVLATAYIEYAPGEQQYLYWYTAELDGEIRQEWTSFGYGDHGIRDLVIHEEGADRFVVVATPDEIEVFDEPARAPARTIATPATQLDAIRVVKPLPAGVARLFACDSNNFYALDFETGAEIDTVPGLGCRAIASGQADGDAEMEIGITGPFGAVVLDSASLAVQWSDALGRGESIAFTDVDGDGAAEVVYAAPDLGVILARDPMDEQVAWQVDADSDVLFDAFELDDSGPSEIVLTNRFAGPVRVLDGATGAELWSVAGWDLGAIALTAGDFDGDGSRDIAFAAGYGSSESRILAVASSSSQEVVSQVDGFGGRYSGLEVLDLDGDGDRELLGGCVSSYLDGNWSSFHLAFDYGSGHVKSRIPLPFETVEGCTNSVAAQFDLDPQPEICTLLGVYSTIADLQCQDALTFELSWQIEFLEGVTPASLLATDLDGDQVPELAVSTDQPAIYVVDGATGWPRFRTEPIPMDSALAVLRAGSVRAPGTVDLVAGGSGMAVFDSASGALLSGPHELSISALDVYEAGPSPLARIFVGTTSGRVAEFDIATGTLSPPIVDYPSAIGSLRVSDVNRDGAADFLTSDGRALTLHGGAENSQIWSSGILSRYVGPDCGLRVGDFDGNTVPEIVVSFDIGVAVFEGPLFSLFTDGFESGDTSAWTSTSP